MLRERILSLLFEPNVQENGPKHDMKWAVRIGPFEMYDQEFVIPSLERVLYRLGGFACYLLPWSHSSCTILHACNFRPADPISWALSGLFEICLALILPVTTTHHHESSGEKQLWTSLPNPMTDKDCTPSMVWTRGNDLPSYHSLVSEWMWYASSRQHRELGKCRGCHFSTIILQLRRKWLGWHYPTKSLPHFGAAKAQFHRLDW